MNSAKLKQLILALTLGILFPVLALLSLPAGEAQGAPLTQAPVLTASKQGVSQWTRRIKLTFTGTVTSTLSDFPALVVLNNSRINYAETQPNGQDLRFVDAAGTLLDYQIESWNPGGTSYVWVRVPQIASTADFIWLYYGNPAAPAGQNPAGVWTNNFQGVWHMDAGLADASPFNNDGQSIRPPATTPAGQIANAQNYSNSRQYIDAGSDASVDNVFSGGGTFSAWIYPVGWGQGPYGRLADKSSSVNADDGWGFQLDQPARTLRFERGYAGGSQGAWLAADDSVQLNDWQYVTLVYQDGTANDPLMYVNGASVGVRQVNTPSGPADSDADQSLWLGNFSGSLNNASVDRAFQGTIDELRLAKGSRSAAWVQAEYRSMIDALLGYGSPEPLNVVTGGVVGAPYTYTITISNTGDQATGVVVSDTVPVGASYVSGGVYSAAGNAVSWTVPAIGQNIAAQVLYVVTTCQLSLYNDAYRVVASDQGVTSAPGPAVISLLTPPTLTADFVHSALVLGQPILFTSTSTTTGGPIVAYTWNFDNGQIAAGATGSTTFDTPGAYPVTLTITDTCGYTDTATQTLTVAAPVLNVTKSAQPQPIAIGQRLTYTIVVANSGLGPATGVVVSDTLAAGGQFDAASLTIDPPAAGGSTGSPPQIATGLTIQPAATVTVTYVVTVTDGPILTNTVWLTSHQTATPLTDTVVVTVVYPDVTISKTVTPTSAVPGQPITFTLTYTNLGPGPAQNVIITDVLPVTLTGVSTFASGSPLTPRPGPDFSWQATSLPANAGGVITITGRVDPRLQADTTLTNTALITASREAGSAPNSSSAQVAVLLPRASFSAGSYQADEFAGAAVITVNLSLAPRAPVSVTYTASNGSAAGGSDFTPVSGALVFAPGTTALTFTVPITNDNLDEPNETVLLALSDPRGVVLSSPQNAVLTIVDNDEVRLALSKSGQPALVRAGQRLTYTIVVSNSGNAPATGGVIYDLLPANTQFITDSLSIQPAGAGAPGSLPVLLTGLTVPANSQVAVSFAVTVTRPITNGLVLTNIAAVTATEAITPLVDVVTNTVLAIPAVSVRKSGPVTATIGSQINFTFAVTNSGDTLLQLLAVDDDLTGPGVFTGGDSNSNGRLDPTETWLYSGVYTTRASDATPILNTVTVTATSPAGTQVSASDNHRTNLEYLPVLTMTKTGPASAVVGQRVVFTFTVAHASTSDGTPVSSMSVIDNYAGTASLVSNGDNDALLELGETWVYTAAYTIKPTSANPLTNTAFAVGRDGNNDLISASAQHATNLSGFDPSLFVDKDGPDSALVGQTVEFTFTVINVNLLAVQLFNLGSLGIAALGDGSPIAITSVTDSVAGAGVYVSGDFNSNGLLDGAEAWVYTAGHTIPAAGGDTLINTVNVAGRDPDGDLVAATDSHFTDIAYGPQLQLARTGPTTATVGQKLDFSYSLSHAPASDGSAVGSLSASNSLAGAAVLLPGGDTNGNSQLDSGETWVYTTSYTVQIADPGLLVNRTTAQGVDIDGDTVIITDTHIIEVDKSGAGGSTILYFPLIFKN